MRNDIEVRVEFYGVPRLRAGCAALHVVGGSVAEALHSVSSKCPGLADLVQGGRLAPHYLLSINGERFCANLTQPLSQSDHLLLLSADAGG